MSPVAFPTKIPDFVKVQSLFSRILVRVYLNTGTL